MIKILSGEMAIELHLQFLIRNNNTDLMILKNTKVSLAYVIGLKYTHRVVVAHSVGDWAEWWRVLGLSPNFRPKLERCAGDTFRALPRYP